MKFELHRGAELRREPRQLPGALYNLAHTLLARSGGVVFVPIRSMQVLAIIDRQEIVFVDGQTKHVVAAAWQRFAPRNRAALDAPVSYEWVHYGKDSAVLTSRLQAEFARALQALAERGPTHRSADVLPLPPPGRKAD